jgi:hypothetical protein
MINKIIKDNQYHSFQSLVINNSLKTFTKNLKTKFVLMVIKKQGSKTRSYFTKIT